MLRCELCGSAIPGLTGLVELQNLKSHMNRKHGLPIGTPEALALRIEYEDAQERRDVVDQLVGSETARKHDARE